MAKDDKGEQEEIPLTGKGVARLKLPAIDKAIAKYQRKKEARCKESAPEKEAKEELRMALHADRDKLPVTGEGFPFYLDSDGVKWILSEKLAWEKPEAEEEV